MSINQLNELIKKYGENKTFYEVLKGEKNEKKN